jgi:hypothetical protein
MPDRADCVAAERALQRAVAAASPRDDELEQALAHVQTCAICSRRFELAVARSYSQRRETLPTVADVPIDQPALFERALTAALAAPEAIARRRAAQRLGELEQVGPPALAALVRAAADDSDEKVRAAALTALDRLDDAVPVPQRLIEAWAREPAEAAPYLVEVLTRLSDPRALASSRVTELVTEETDVWNRLSVRGESGAAGEIVRKDDQFWLKLNRLPAEFENATPVVAIPSALEAGEAEIEWSGGSPGLAFAAEPVAEGALELFLASVADPAARRALSEGLFARVYLLNPRKRGAGI